VTSQNWPDGD